MHCLSTRQSPPIIQMKILKPPYETSFFTNFLVEIFSNVTFAIRESPLTFYVILWIMQTFFFKKRKKTDVKIVLISRLTSLPIKTMILNYLSNKCIYAEKANFDRVCMMIFSSLEVQKNCRLNHEHGASLRSRFPYNWGFCKKAYMLEGKLSKRQKNVFFQHSDNP